MYFRFVRLGPRANYVERGVLTALRADGLVAHSLCEHHEREIALQSVGGQHRAGGGNDDLKEGMRKAGGGVDYFQGRERENDAQEAGHEVQVRLDQRALVPALEAELSNFLGGCHGQNF